MELAHETRKMRAVLDAEVDLSDLPADRADTFRARLDRHFPALFAHFHALYGHRHDASIHLRRLVVDLAAFAAHHPPTDRPDDAPWFQSEQALGMAVYVDLYAGDLRGLIERIPDLVERGITYLHLMPLYASPEGNSDGGYAVSDYRTVDPALGDTDDLRALGDALHDAGIRLVLDFVFNHTSDEHRWAQAAQAGDPRYADFYFLLDEAEARAYDVHLREIFPQVRRGSFTWNEATASWVWTTFNSFQWDLNYANPDVFASVASEMLHLVSMGADVLRLDALAFVWKQQGTRCESLPEAHTVIRAFKACLDLAAPHVVFKSEAIVHPDEVATYIGTDQCELSYDPLLMALLWESLATRRTELLEASLARSFAIPDGCAWVNYVRCHDDIGWTWDDAVAAELGIDSAGHRAFLNRFYTGRFDGSFGDGVPFAENADTGDCRVCGTLASLAGVERAVRLDDDGMLDDAVARVRLLHGVLLSMPGVPLLYQGDDLGVLNDHAYLDEPDKAGDSRWVHRKALTAADRARADDPETPQGRISADLDHLIGVRRRHQVFGPSSFALVPTDDDHLLVFVRATEHERLLVVANVAEHERPVPAQLADLLDDDLDLAATAPVAGAPDRIGGCALHWFWRST